MKKNLFISILFVLSFIAVQLFNPNLAYADTIEDYAITIDVLNDGKINVTEKILYNFEGRQGHGIYRDINYTKTNIDNKKFMFDISNIKIVDENDEKYNYELTTDSLQKHLKIGDADKTVTGIKRYIISYTVAGAITYFDNFDEIYWNAIGTDWTVTTKNASVEVNIPAELNLEQIKTSCYTGPFKSTLAECSSRKLYFTDLSDSSKPKKTKVSFSSFRKLEIGDGFSVAVGFPKNVVSVLEPKSYRPPLSTILWTMAFIIVGILWYLVYPIHIFIKYYKNLSFINKNKRVLTADYDIPKVNEVELSPAQVGMLVDKTVGKEDFTATIVDLARRGFLTIQINDEKDWNPFNDDTKVTFTKSKSYESDSSIRNFEKTLLDKFFDNGDTVDIKSISKDYSFALTIKSFEEQVSKSIKQLKLSTNDLVETKNFYQGLAIFSVLSVNPLMMAASIAMGPYMLLLTEKGVEAFSRAKSLNNFLESQDRQLNFQSKYQYWFEKLLPYATSFKVEKIWSDRFKQFDIKNPTWLSTNRSDFTTFNALSSINSSVASTYVSSTRSSSGFSSGGSGGGFSGGGGGGGGGGGW